MGFVFKVVFRVGLGLFWCGSGLVWVGLYDVDMSSCAKSRQVVRVNVGRPRRGKGLLVKREDGLETESSGEINYIKVVFTHIL